MQDRDQLGGRDTVVKKVLEALEEEGIDTVTDREYDLPYTLLAHHSYHC